MMAWRDGTAAITTAPVDCTAVSVDWTDSEVFSVIPRLAPSSFFVRVVLKERKSLVLLNWSYSLVGL